MRRTVLKGSRIPAGGVPPMPWVRPGLAGAEPGWRYPRTSTASPPTRADGSSAPRTEPPLRRGEEIHAETSGGMLARPEAASPIPPLAKGGLGGVALARPLGTAVGSPACELVRVDLDCERPRPTPPTPPSQGGEWERLPLVPATGRRVLCEHRVDGLGPEVLAEHPTEARQEPRPPGTEARQEPRPPGIHAPRLTMGIVAGLILVATTTFTRAAEPDPARKIDFNYQIRPILSDKCFNCHGPDAGKRKAGLRLDTKDGAFAKLKSDGHAIVPGNLEESELVARITAEDETERMPPKSLGRTLTAQEIELLKRWVEQGAEWKDHWAFLPPGGGASAGGQAHRPGPGIRSTGSSWPGSRPRGSLPRPRRARSG